MYSRTTKNQRKAQSGAKHHALKKRTDKIGKSSQSMAEDRLKEDFVNKILRGH